MRVGFRVALFALLAAWACPRTVFAARDCIVTVKSGDTLSKIAVKHAVSERQIIQSNPVLKKDPNLLRLGQELDICAAQDLARGTSAKGKSEPAKRCGKNGRVVLHEVGSGDTLGRVAHRYGVSEAALQHQNVALREHPDVLRVGQELEICIEGASKSPSRGKSKLCNNETPLHFHRVVPGEHLGQIAGRYGVRRRDLLQLNASLRANPDMLKVGQELRVCPLIAPRERQRIEYSVQPGDTIGSIAKRYALTPGELIRYQQGKLVDPNALRDGQTLHIWADGAIVSGFREHRDDDTGVLKSGLQLPPGLHYVVKRAAAAWGTAKTVRTIQSAIGAYQRRKPGGPKIHVGDISKRGGGHFPPHLSHQHGRDVDIGYVLTGAYANEVRFRSASASNFDAARNWALLKAFIDTDEVRYIFVDYRLQGLLYNYARDHGVSEDVLDELMQYPRGRGRTHGLIRHWKGHVNHFHVRFRK